MASELNKASYTERQLVTFLLGEEEFGADIMDVKEIIRVPDITRVPNAPSFVEGACNLRGNVLPIINGRMRLNLEKKDADESSRVLVIDVEGKATGMVVDRVLEVMRVNTAEIEETPQIVKSVDSDYINGVVKLDNGSRLIMLLDVVKSLSIQNAIKSEFQAVDRNASQLGTVQDNETAKIAAEEQLVSFLLGKEEYAIGIMEVKEIIRVPQIVKVPNCGAYLEGVVSLRGNLLPVLNLRTYLSMEHLEVNDQTRILVVDMGVITAGIMVDRISEVLRVSSSLIQAPPKFATQGGEQLKGVAKLQNGKRMILLLDPSKMISAEDVDALHANQSVDELDAERKSISRKMTEEEKLVTFRIGAEEYGVKIDNVQEIIRMSEITKVPRVPRHVEGVVNLRGNVIPAIDLRRLFQLEDKQVTDATRIMIVDFAQKKTGIIVDSVSEVLTLEKSLVEPTPEILSSGVDSDYIEGVAKLNDGKRMILILDIGKVLGY